MWYLGRGEDEGELEEGPGPDGEHGEAELFVGVHLLVLIEQSVKCQGNVRCA
jgi:hypothetical protein